MLTAPPYENNRAIVDACKPYGRLADFPETTQTSPEYKAEMRRKFPDLFESLQ